MSCSNGLSSLISRNPVPAFAVSTVTPVSRANCSKSNLRPVTKKFGVLPSFPTLEARYKPTLAIKFAQQILLPMHQRDSVARNFPPKPESFP